MALVIMEENVGELLPDHKGATVQKTAICTHRHENLRTYLNIIVFLPVHVLFL
jgi:hypothetical protein